MKYKLIKRGNPQKKEEPKKWYATPNSEKAMSEKEMTKAATANTSTAPIEMEAAFEHLANFVPMQMRQGHTVRIPGLGTFRLSFKSQGVEDINKFNAGTMIREPRIIFKPSKELRESVMKNLTFENGGVLEDGINYASITDYNKAKGNTGSAGSTPEEDEPVVQ